MSTKRITINILATYTQTAVSVIVGFFTIRMIFKALGETMYGIFGVVGSIIAFAAIFNNVMTNANARFFAYAIGEGRKYGAEHGRIELFKWFNTSLAIHIVLALLLCGFLYPIGLCVIKNELTIPTEILPSSIIVFKISILTLFFTILTIPFYAIYTAKQLIFVRNFANIIQTLLCAAEGWYILNYNGNRLVTHSLLNSSILIFVHISITVLAFLSFKECRINKNEWFNKKRFKEIFTYTSFSIFGNIGNTLAGAGVNVVMNIFYGPQINSMIGIGNSISLKTEVLSGAIHKAISPEITSRIGAKNIPGATSLAIDVSLFSATLSLIVITPIIYYLHPLLVLWLETPPQGTAQLITIMLISSFILDSTSGYMMLIHAFGKIKIYSVTLGAINGCCVVFAYIFSLLDTNNYHPLINLSIAWFIPRTLHSLGRIVFAKKILNLKIKTFFIQIFSPLSLIFTIIVVSNYYLKTIIFCKSPILNTLIGILCLCITNIIFSIIFILVYDLKITKKRRIQTFYYKILGKINSKK